MLPTNFFPDEPPSPDPELDPELDPEPELEPEDALDEDPELEPEPEPEEAPLDEELVEPEEASDPEPEDEAVADESLSGVEPELVPLPPPSSPDDWFELPEDPQAISTDATAAGRTRCEREARCIDNAVAARNRTRQRMSRLSPRRHHASATESDVGVLRRNVPRIGQARARSSVAAVGRALGLERVRRHRQGSERVPIDEHLRGLLRGGCEPRQVH